MGTYIKEGGHRKDRLAFKRERLTTGLLQRQWTSQTLVYIFAQRPKGLLYY